MDIQVDVADSFHALFGVMKEVDEDFTSRYRANGTTHTHHSPIFSTEGMRGFSVPMVAT